MARSEVHSTSSATLDKLALAPQGVQERRLRRISAWLLLFFLLQGELGAVWDREWHAYVGRDQFWTPPHTLIYSCVAGAGLLALAVVLVETFRYRHHVPGVDDTSTVPVLHFFHAPLGFSVLGFGALLALIAAPLDNYWHELYGIDIALWAPFHMMGVTGGLIGMLGMVYVFASEAAIERQSGSTPRRFLGLTALELGIIMAMGSIMNYVLTGFLQFPVITIGTIHISTYPLPLVAGCVMFMLAALRTTQKVGIATFLTFILFLHTLVVELFVPWAIRTAVEQQDIPYRLANQIPEFRLDYALLPAAFLLSAVILDVVAYRRARKTGSPNSPMLQTIIQGAIVTLPIVLFTPLILRDYTPYAPVFLPEKGVPFDPVQMAGIVIISLLIAMAIGALGAWLGEDFGDIWRWSKR
ncbi:hypothetical protein [Dictyobacter formicarum]|uniref:Cytochrome oxidase subunit I profile domain-containing protein n=1 Tax=Dictyobacter formicarum TaxID=2778368 RepID=A0ABQ3VD30_9CHLR|nr:hypothetical protein [Dictyobacter formicarum]GHO83381.1 hypothetical protein KSZ_13870 [Dictyobacter formicarum]